MKNGFVFASLIATVVLTSGGFADAATKWKITAPAKGTTIASKAMIVGSGTGAKAGEGKLTLGHLSAAGAVIVSGSVPIFTTGNTLKWTATLVPPGGGWTLSTPNPAIPLTAANPDRFLWAQTFTAIAGSNADSTVAGITIVK